MALSLNNPPTSKILRWVTKNKTSALKYIGAVWELSRMQVNVTINGVVTKNTVVFTGRNAELNLNLGTINTSGGGGGTITITHPFQISASTTAGNISVLYGTLNDILPTDVGTDYSLSNGTNTVYLEVEVDIDGEVVDVVLGASTSGQPADDDYYGYITLGSVVVSDGVVGAIRQAATHSLRMAMCGRVVLAGTTLDERGTYEFWGF